MRALLVSYAEIGVNSTNHVLSFARGLALTGWEVSVAVLRKQHFREGFAFYKCNLDGSLAEATFSHLTPFEIVHLWTARGAIWEFLRTNAFLIGARLLVHLEDDEGEVLKAFSAGRISFENGIGIRALEKAKLAHLSHPVLSRCLVACADGVTYLSPEQALSVPSTVPAKRIVPPLENKWFAQHRAKQTSQCIDIVYAGGVHHAVADDFRALCEAVSELNKKGISARLLRTGPSAVPSSLIKECTRDLPAFIDLGFLDESKLIDVISSADVLVQPGSPTAFNRRRFPAKLAPYFASGVPVVLPACYAWLGIRDGEHAIMLKESSSQEIATAVEWLVTNPSEAQSMARRGREWAARAFDILHSGSQLGEFYTTVLNTKSYINWSELNRPLEQLPIWLASKPDRNLRISSEALLKIAAEAAQGVARNLRLNRMPLVSVIVPNYNHAKFLPERLRSIFGQTYTHIEVIVLDDASSDNSLDILAAAQKNFSFKIVSNARNSGSPFAQWQKGIGLATGEYIWIAESDDTAEPELLGRLVETLNVNAGVGIAYAQSQLVNESGVVIRNCIEDTQQIHATRWSRNYINSGQAEVAEFLIVKNTIPNASACLFRAEALRDIEFANVGLRVCGDWWIYCQILKRFDIAFVAATLNGYRTHAGSARARSYGSGTLLNERMTVQLWINRNFNVRRRAKTLAARDTLRELLYCLRSELVTDSVILEGTVFQEYLHEIDPGFRDRLSELVVQHSVGQPLVALAGMAEQAFHPSPWKWESLDCPGDEALQIKVPPYTYVVVGHAPAIESRRLTGRVAVLQESPKLEILTTAGTASVEWAQRREGFGDEVPVSAPELRAAGLPDLNDKSDCGRRMLMLLPHLELGGADKYNLEIAHELAASGSWTVDILTTRPSDDMWLGEFSRYCRYIIRSAVVFNDSEYIESIRQTVEALSPNVLLLSHSVIGYQLLPLLRQWLPCATFVDLVHIVTPEWRNGGFPQLTTERRDCLDGTIVTSDCLRRWLVQRGVVESKVRLCYTNTSAGSYPTELEAQRTAQTRWGVNKGSAVLLFAGRFCDQKQVRLLPSILQKVIRKHDQAVLVVAGDGPDRPWLDKELFERFPFHAKYVGALEPEELTILMSGADILLLPSKNEGIALTLFESLAMGVVVVATDVGGQAELINESCGVLLQNGERLADEMAESICTLLDSPLKMEEMANAGRARFQEFSSRRKGDKAILQIISEFNFASSPQRSALAIHEIEKIKKDVNETLRAERRENQLSSMQTSAGKVFPNAASRFASRARRLPVVGRWAVAVERRFGERIGRFIMRWV